MIEIRSSSLTKVLGIGALMALCLVAMLSSASAAYAGKFCQGAWLAPYGQGGDRCWGSAERSLNWAAVETHERAGCVDIADGANNLTQAWACGAAGSGSGYAMAVSIPIDPNGYFKGVIRNNNSTYGAYFGGEQACYALYPC